MEAEDQTIAPGLEKEISRFFWDVVKIGLKNPRFLFSTLMVMQSQWRAAKVRKRHEKSGIHVPPFMIFSITERCNLSCKGCYAKALQKGNGEEVSTDRVRGLLEDARALGIATVLVAGGEPLLRPEIFEITRDFPTMVFPVFTNGMLLDEKFTVIFKRQRQCIPVISIEGSRADTDSRRGEGVFARAACTIGRLRKAGVFCGISLTVTRSNFDLVTSDDFVKQYLREGCRLFFFVEYVPVAAGTDDLTLDARQRSAMTALSASLLSKYDALFIAFPGDEEKFGGCLAAGRGFVHVNPQGDLEACPMAPFSDVNLRNVPLAEGLASPLLRAIRENHDLLRETNGGCALWEKRELVKELVTANTNTTSGCPRSGAR